MKMCNNQQILHSNHVFVVQQRKKSFSSIKAINSHTFVHLITFVPLYKLYSTEEYVYFLASAENSLTFCNKIFSKEKTIQDTDLSELNVV